jgi:uncharacterized repeat protein (TIGR01451 family)
MNRIGVTQKRDSLYLLSVFALVLAALFPAATPVQAVADSDAGAFSHHFSQVFPSWWPFLGPLGAPRERPLFQEADHFEFNTIATPQVAGQSFSVTITAKDAEGSTVTDYAGTAGLTDTTGTIAPTTTGSFSGGVWTGSVTITKAQSGVTITATDGAATGTSNGFTVDPAPLHHIVIRDASGGGGSEVGARTMSIYATLGVWAAGYDAHDNYREDLSVSWSLADGLGGSIQPPSGTSATFTPPASSDTGTIQATHSASGFTDKTGTITVQAPQLAISKKDAPDPVMPGQVLTYTIVYTNVGTAAAQNVRITETYDPNVSYVSANPAPDAANVWTQATLDPDAKSQIVVTVNVTEAIDPGASLINTVAVSALRLQETTTSATTVVTGTSNLTMTLDSSPNPVDAGDVLTYHVRYRNNGTARVNAATLQLYYDWPKDRVTFVGSNPEPTSGSDITSTWELKDLSIGEGGTIDVRVAVDDYVLDQETLWTYGTIWDKEPSFRYTPENTLVNAPALELIKSATPDPVFADDRLVYTLVYTNGGHATASGLAVTDAVPINTDFVSCEPSGCSRSGDIVTWSVGDLEPEAGATATMVVDVHRNVGRATTLTNTARVRVLETPNYSATAQIATTIVSSPSLELTISNGKSSVKAGENLEYVLTYRNNGSGTFENTTILATPPSSQYVEDVDCSPSTSCKQQGSQWRYDIGSLSGGESGTVRLFASVKDPLPVGARSIVASAIISAEFPGSSTASDSAEDKDEIATHPDLVVKAFYEDEMPWPGKYVTYTVHYSNIGHIATTGVVMTATRPPFSTFRKGASDICWEPQSGGRYTCKLGNLDYGDSGDPLFVVTLPNTPFTPEMTDFDAAFEIGDKGESGEDANPDSNVFEARLGVPNLVIRTIKAQPAIWSGGSGFLWAIIENRGTGTACGVYNPDGCTGFALDLFIDPQTPPVSYPIQEYGDCYVFVSPVEPGIRATAVISFTVLPRALWPNNGAGFCQATMLEEVWAKVDNWDPTQPPYPAGSGLVPESDEGDNVFGPFTPGMDIFLPIVMRSY